MIDFFVRLSSGITRVVGTPWALLVAFAVIVVWAVSGPMFDFSDTWQLAINTGTTIVTFLMVFVIQATQNREARVTQLKLDELLRALEGARNSLIALEDAEEERVENHASEMRELAANHTEEKLDELEEHGERAAATARSNRAASKARRARSDRARNGTSRKRSAGSTRRTSTKETSAKATNA